MSCVTVRSVFISGKQLRIPYPDRKWLVLPDKYNVPVTFLVTLFMKHDPVPYIYSLENGLPGNIYMVWDNVTGNM